jgi:hypothetical protein
MADYVPPKQNPEKYEQLPSSNSPSGYAPARSGGGGTGQIVLGLLMLVGGIGLSVAGTGRVFIGLIAVGVITLVKGIAAAGR